MDGSQGQVLSRRSIVFAGLSAAGGLMIGVPVAANAKVQPAVLADGANAAKEMTAFLAAARERGCRVQVGSDMLFEQIPAYLEYFGYPSTTPEARTRAAAEKSIATEERIKIAVAAQIGGNHMPVLGQLLGALALEAGEDLRHVLLRTLLLGSLWYQNAVEATSSVSGW